jgi:hypothetical protein
MIRITRSLRIGLGLAILSIGFTVLAPTPVKAQNQQYMVNDLEARTRAAMDSIKQTLDASISSDSKLLSM